ncbi:hypothetical protein TrCOL_g871 [Triparma columacea]|uniref:Mitochondrial inner membrane protease subunit n=1 Tax=Triparma columacea TaxID=722753 RepID=A0A9W7G584_9STRA|nr:hypothetical protein TrCOL_g871 [Triparma columacea]
MEAEAAISRITSTTRHKKKYLDSLSCQGRGYRLCCRGPFRILLLTLLTLAMTNALSPQGQLKAKFQQAKAERFGMRARNAAINCTVGDTIVPLIRNLETRQGLANRGVYAGVEYDVISLTLPSGEQPRTLSQVDPELRKEATAKIRPRYPLRDNLERPDWPVSVPLSDAPLWVSRSTYEAGTAVGTLLFSLTSLLLAATIAYFVQFVSVPSPSMVPTLNPGNVVLVTRSLTFRVGDVVLFSPPPSVDKVTKDISERIDAQPTSTKGQKFIKRVVAVPGERVGVRNSSPFVQVSERKFRFDVVGPYARPEIFPKSSWDRPPEELKRGEYFVSGDNGFRSVDSRVWGPLEGKYVIGKARCIVWPLDQVGMIKPGEIIEVVKGDE